MRFCSALLMKREKIRYELYKDKTSQKEIISLEIRLR